MPVTVSASAPVAEQHVDDLERWRSTSMPARNVAGSPNAVVPNGERAREPKPVRPVVESVPVLPTARRVVEDVEDVDLLGLRRLRGDHEVGGIPLARQEERDQSERSAPVSPPSTASGPSSAVDQVRRLREATFCETTSGKTSPVTLTTSLPRPPMTRVADAGRRGEHVERVVALEPVDLEQLDVAYADGRAPAP